MRSVNGLSRIKLRGELAVAGSSLSVCRKLCFRHFLDMAFFLRIHGVAVAKRCIIRIDSSVLIFDLFKLFHGAVGFFQGKAVVVAR